MIIPFYGMEENDTFTPASSYLTLILSFFNKSTFLVRNRVHFSGHTGTANRLIKVREEKEGVLCGFPILSSFTKDNPPLAGHLDRQVFMFRHFLSNRKMPFGDFSSKIIVVFNKDTLRACLTNFSTNFESWWKLNGKKGREEKNLLHYVQNENQKGKEIVGKIQRALWERKCFKKILISIILQHVVQKFKLLRALEKTSFWIFLGSKKFCAHIGQTWYFSICGVQFLWFNKIFLQTRIQTFRYHYGW